MTRALSFSLFLAIALAVVGGMHFYVWARLVRDPGLEEPWRRGLTIAIAVGALAIPASLFARRLLPRGALRALAAPVYVWLGFAFLLFSVLVAVDLLRVFTSATGWVVDLIRRAPEAPPDPDRRLFLARAMAGGAALAAGAATLSAVRSATGDPEIHEVPVRLERLPPALSGLSIAQITDLHVGPTLGGHHVRRVVEATNALAPDVVAITGDLVDGTVRELGPAIAELSRLRARYGVYFVTGNHEYYSGVGPWVTELRRLGIRVLRNERVVDGASGPRAASIDLAGVDDWGAGRFGGGHGADLDRALAGRDSERSLVLLAHQPRGVGEAVRSGVELQISGHTHGGQIFPFSLLVSAFYPYVKGLYRHREGEAQGQIFVSRGTGYWGPPMRLGSPPEIARIILTS